MATLLLCHTSPVAPTVHVPPQCLSEERFLSRETVQRLYRSGLSFFFFFLINPGIVTVKGGKRNRNVEMPWDTCLAQDVSAVFDLRGYFGVGKKGVWCLWGLRRELDFRYP
jgi:hypothetical protein